MTPFAFVHIEKAAGTTFTHLLRKNFFPRYLDIRPLTGNGLGQVTARDMRIAARLNPLLVSFAGHAVQTISDLDDWRPDTRYVTILRDPVSRYMSQFNYWNKQLTKNVTMEQFLADEETWNFQTRKIAGDSNVAAAMEQLHNRFFHVGVVEHFDEFLVTLRQKMLPFNFKINYTVRNVGAGTDSNTGSAAREHYDEIVARNRLDIELYEHVKEVLLPRYRSEYPGDVQNDVSEFTDANRLHVDRSLTLYVDYLVRKLYFEPITGAVRLLHGLTYYGSYETR